MHINIKRTDIVIFIIMLIIFITYIFLKLFSIKSEKILLDYAENKSYQLVNNLINNIVYKKIYDKNDELIELVTKNDEIISVNFNNSLINNFIADFSSNMFNEINKIERNELIFFIPSGIIYNVPILNNIGPKIPIKLNFLSNADIKSNIDVNEYGINNSIIKVNLIINVNIEVIMPFLSKRIQIEREIPISTKIVNGSIPLYYGK